MCQGTDANLMWDVIIRNFVQHISGQFVYHRFPGLAATSSRVFGLNIHNVIQYTISCVCLIPVNT